MADRGVPQDCQGLLQPGPLRTGEEAEAARTTLEEALAETVIEGLLEIEERGVLLRSHGI